MGGDAVDRLLFGIEDSVGREFDDVFLNSIRVTRNGLLQRGEGIDYTQTNSTTGLITFTSTLLSTDLVEVIYTSQGNPS